MSYTLQEIREDVRALMARVGIVEAGLADVETEFGTVTSWTPTLIGGTTNPNLGAGGNVVGQYLVTNGWCFAHARWFWSGAGVSGGSGVYSVAPPVTPNAGLAFSSTTYGGSTVGHGGGRDDSATSASRVCRIQAVAADDFRFHSIDAVAYWANTVPFTWGAVGDRLSIALSFPIA